MNHGLRFGPATTLALTLLLTLGRTSTVLSQEVLPTEDPPAPGTEEPQDPVQPLQVGAAEVLPPSSMLGGAGESCRARSDCETGLRCLANVCRDPLEGTTCGSAAECGAHLRCVQQVCRAPFDTSTSEGPAAQREDHQGDTDPYVGLRQIRGFIGASVMGGIGLAGDLAFLGGIRAGLYARRNELAIEVTPFSAIYGYGLPVFQLNVSYAYLLPMLQRQDVVLYWPIRVGAGFVTGNSNGNVFIEARADVVGLALQIGQVVLDFHAPSFRFAWTPGVGPTGTTGSAWSYWFGGVSASYVF